MRVRFRPAWASRVAGLALVAWQAGAGRSFGSDPAGVSGAPAPGLYRSCGLNALAVACRLKGVDVGLDRLADLLRPDDEGNSSVADLERAAQAVGLTPVAARVDLAHLARAPMPAIVHLRTRGLESSASHYVVLLGLFREGVVMIDPPTAATYHPYDEFRREWSGVVLAFPDDEAGRSAFVASLGGGPAWPGPRALAAAGGLGLVALTGLGLASARRRWRRPMAAGLAALACGWAGCGPASPRLEVPEGVVDLGVVEPGEVELSVPIANRGGASLHVSGVNSTCSCTVPEAPGPLAAGASGSIRGVVSARPGPGSAELAVDSDDPAGRRVVRLRWFGRAEPALVPSTLRLAGRPGAAVEAGLEVSYPGGDPGEALEVLGAEGLPAGFALEVVDNDPEAIRAHAHLSDFPVVGRARLRLRGAAPAGPGEAVASARVLVRQRGAEHALPLALRVEADPGFRAEPGRLLFGASSPEALLGMERTALLRSDREGDRFEVESAPDYLRAELAEGAGPGPATLTVRVVGEPDGPFARGEVLLRNAEGARLALPVLMGSGR